MTRKLRILVDCHQFDGIYQGSRTFLRGLYSQLAKSDVLDIYLAAHNVGLLEEEFRPVSDRVKFIELKSTKRSRRLLWEFPEHIRRHQVDYAHYQYIDAPLKRARTIITIHDVLFLDLPKDFSWLYRQKKYLMKLAAVRADILTTDSEYSKASIQRHFGINPEKVHVVRPGLEQEFLDVAPEDRRAESRERVRSKFGIDNVILYVSRVEPRKNHALLLEAFLELQLWKRGYHLVFVGAMAIASKKFSQVRALVPAAAQPFVHHYEQASHETVMDLMRGCSIFVYPSKAEGFGYPPIEAGALGVETILSSGTSLGEFEFFGARLFPPDDPLALKRSLNSIATGEIPSPPMDSVAQVIRKEFTWDRSAALLEQLLISDARR